MNATTVRTPPPKEVEVDAASASRNTPNAAAGVAIAMSADHASTSCLFLIVQYGLQHERESVPIQPIGRGNNQHG